MTEGRVLSRYVLNNLILQRQRLGIDQKDEVWDGVYVIMPEPTNVHQRITSDLTVVLRQVVPKSLGDVLPGANVSDRKVGWKKNFRAPDVVVVLHSGRAQDCDTHWLGGPDFLVEVRSPGDDTNAKVPFYSRLGVRELLIIHRDTRRLDLYRHDGDVLSAVPEQEWRNGQWFVSEVLPLAFRRRSVHGQKRQIEIRRTDGQSGRWVF